MIVCQFKTHWILTNVKISRSIQIPIQKCKPCISMSHVIKGIFLWIIKGTLVKKRLNNF